MRRRTGDEGEHRRPPRELLSFAHYSPGGYSAEVWAAWRQARREWAAEYGWPSDEVDRLRDEARQKIDAIAWRL